MAPYTEEDLLQAQPKEVLYAKIIDIIQASAYIHDNNYSETIYLKDYLYGKQDVYVDKVKHTRTNINNKTVENWAYAIVDFKKSFLLGKPIQYVQSNMNESEISKLNNYIKFSDKKKQDMLLYEDVLSVGRGFRYVNKNPRIDEDNPSPFELINSPAEHTEVVYSNRLGNEQLLSYVVTPMHNILSNIDPTTGELNEEVQEYNEYTVYLRNRALIVSNKTGEFVVTEDKPLLWNEHIITEYFVNPKRIGLIEIGKDLFNDINYLQSMDKDDMEQYVNAIMVFTNAEFDDESLEEMSELGAVSINSTDNKKASVDLLQKRLNATDTQPYYMRLLSALHQILGVPLASDNGSVSYGDTGKAKLTGQGYTSAGIRAEGDETMIGSCDRKALKVMLKISRDTKGSDIKNLRINNIDIKFQRDMSDNLLTKAQALLSLINADVPREIANTIVNLFNDPNYVTDEQQKLFGDQESQLSSKTKHVVKSAEEQNNNITTTTETDNQGQ